MYYVHDEKVILTSFKVRNVLSKAIRSMDPEAKDYGFQCFRKSGANLVLEMKVPLEHIKRHGHWKSDGHLILSKGLSKNIWFSSTNLSMPCNLNCFLPLHFSLVLFV